MSALVIHIQVVLMSALALVAFVVYRTLVGPVSLPSPPGVGIGRDMSSASSAPRVGLRHAAPRRRFLLGPLAYPSLSASPLGRVWARLGLAVVAIALPAMVGMALAAVQLLPLAELSQFSPRGGGVDYAFATQYALPSLQLISLLFPDFLVLDGAYWGVWSRWEVHPYVGVAPLILAVFAVVLVRNRYTWFFLALALVGLNLAIGEQSLLGLHRWLVQWPLLNVLRVPGRFTYLFSFGVAVLAAQGAAYLARELRWRPPSTDVLPGRHGNTYLLVAIIVGVQVLAVVLPLALGLASALFAANKDAAVRLLAQFALPLRGLDPQYTVEHLYLATRSALDIAQPSTLRQLVLLLATATLLLLWERLRALGWLWPVALVALVAVDLLAAAVLFHPTVALRDLAAPSGPERFLAEQAGLYRAYTWNRSRDEPNRLLRLGLTDANGYSSLQPTRHAAYAARALEAENRLLDLWNVRYVVRSHRTHAPNEFALTSFNPDRPLASSTRRNPGDIVRFRVPETLADRLELVTTLRAAATVPQSAIVAQLLTTDSAGQQHSFAVRAGLHTADWAWDRPHVHGTVEHLQPPIAYTWQQQADAGPFAAHFYYAAFDLGAAHSIRQVEVQFVHPTAQVQIYGLTLINTPTQSHTPITSLTNANYRQVFSDPDIGVYESLAVLPRAYLVPSAVVVRPAESALDLITRSDFRPEQTVILEEPVSGRLLGSLAAPDPAARPSVTTTAERPTEHECSRDSHDCHVSAGARDR
ncbi:MAG: hypothetical protein CL878_13050 [Dehalococcoidia bacterium]|nr:hypothetical protein [Dehalococcoidia bacterium]